MHNANPDLKNANGDTPLMIACKMGKENFIKLLIKVLDIILLRVLINSVSYCCNASVIIIIKYYLFFETFF